jgi:addiction module RelE/StbE family toxin
LTRLRWTAPAAKDLYSIVRYIRRDNPDAALRVAKVIYDGCENLVDSPHIGQPGKKRDTRELVLSGLPYIAMYRIVDTTVEILHIWHAAQSR